jgi:hypothetical protein
MYVKDNAYAALQFKRVLACLMQGGNDAAVTLAYAKVCEKLYGWPAAIAKAVLAQSRELIMPSMMTRRDALGDAVYKASVGAGTTSDPNFAGPLVAYAQFGAGWLASLINSMFGAIVALCKQLPINTRFAVTTGIGVAGAPAEAGWTPVTRFDFGGDITVAQAVRAIVTLSNDLLKFKAPYAMELLNEELGHAITIATDVVAAGILLDGISPTASTNNARQDVAAGFAGINLGQGSKPLVVTTPAVAKDLALQGQTEGPPAFPDIVIPGGGSICGVPLISCDALSNYGSYGDLLLVIDASQIAGDSGVVVASAATSGSIQMLDGGLGSPSEGAQMVSLFETDSTALKLERWFSLVRLRSTAVAAIKHCAYGVGSPS